MPSPVIVLKFGGSVLREDDDLGTATHEVYRWVRRGYKVVAVVSAFEGQTDALAERARAVSQDLSPGPTSLLLGTGELTSAALMGLALDRAGLVGGVAAPWEIGLEVRGDVLDSTPVAVDAQRMLSLLTERDFVVVPGFVGLGDHGRLSLLGRGGSDLSALFLAHALGSARCRLIKDVDGLYESDPAAPGPRPRRFAALRWTRALELDGGIVQHKAVRFAQEHGLPIEVATWLSDDPTRVGEYVESFGDAPRGTPRRVALLGCGTVGLGVYRLLQRLPDRFAVSAVCVRDPAKAITNGVDPRLVTADAAAFLEADWDTLVETTGDTASAGEVITQSLRDGRNVVTAGKAVVAKHLSDSTWRRAHVEGRLVYSSAVGGVAPVLETIRRANAHGPVARIEGVINGTTNAVLDRVSSGEGFDEAVRWAQSRGLAEADPSRDLTGLDAADKLVLLAFEAFGVSLEIEQVRRTTLSTQSINAELRANAVAVLRHVATLEFRQGSLHAAVELRSVDVTHPLANLPGAMNRVIITGADGSSWIAQGVGAGRWPTAEAVIADLLELGAAGKRASSRAPAPDCREEEVALV